MENPVPVPPVHHKIHMGYPGIKPRLSKWQAGCSYLKHGIASFQPKRKIY